MLNSPQPAINHDELADVPPSSFFGYSIKQVLNAMADTYATDKATKAAFKLRRGKDLIHKLRLIMVRMKKQEAIWLAGLRQNPSNPRHRGTSGGKSPLGFSQASVNLFRDVLRIACSLDEIEWLDNKDCFGFWTHRSGALVTDKVKIEHIPTDLRDILLERRSEERSCCCIVVDENVQPTALDEAEAFVISLKYYLDFVPMIFTYRNKL